LACGTPLLNAAHHFQQCGTPLSTMRHTTSMNAVHHFTGAVHHSYICYTSQCTCKISVGSYCDLCVVDAHMLEERPHCFSQSLVHTYCTLWLRVTSSCVYFYSSKNEFIGVLKYSEEASSRARKPALRVDTGACLMCESLLSQQGVLIDSGQPLHERWVETLGSRGACNW
jgi:hypothetical protein